MLLKQISGLGISIFNVEAKKKEGRWMGCLFQVVSSPSGCIAWLCLMESLMSVLPPISGYLTPRRDEVYVSPFDYQV